MEVLSKYLVHKLIESEVICEEESEIYLFGLELIINSGFVTISILVLGLLVGKPLLAGIFLIALMNLRHYAGGYHAKSYAKCFIISCSSFMLSYVMVILQIQWQLKHTLIALSLISMLYLVRQGTVNSIKNPKTDEELIIRKRRTRIYSILYSVISCSMFFWGNQYLDIATIIICSQIATALAVFRAKREEKNR